MRVAIAIVCLFAAASAGGLAVGGSASPALRTPRLNSCPALGARAAPAARKYKLRCLLNEARTRRGRAKLTRSAPLRLVAERLLGVRCIRSTSGCGSAFEDVLSSSLRAVDYTGNVRYVYYDLSKDPSAVAAYIRTSQSWLSSRLYRDLGIAFRPARARAASKNVWIVIAGYRFKT